MNEVDVEASPGRMRVDSCYYYDEENKKHHREPMDTPAYAQHSTGAGVMAIEWVGRLNRGSEKKVVFDVVFHNANHFALLFSTCTIRN